MLTDAQIAEAAPTDRAYKMADSNGLYLYITRAGAKSWRLKYRFGGHEQRLTFGLYPEITVERARELRDQARLLLKAKQDPRRALEVVAQRDAAFFLLTPPETEGTPNVYFVRQASGLIKIGVTRNLPARLAQLQLGGDRPLELMGVLSGGFATEGMLHRLFAESAVGGEWFTPSPRLLEFIEENIEVAG
ncbi:integrase arm-type DNA-binding domain-containing protein [Sphingomonas montanisoli]|nr:integrase arm-type DNA-binding domain-containing protein [Sphingomonas montanisoli]